MAKSLKILVSGDVGGNFDQLFNRVKSVQKKAGPFDMLFCVGNFFGDDNSQWEAYHSGAAKVPIETFVLGPNESRHQKHFSDPEGCDLCTNVTYLGKKGLYTGSSGLKIAYLSGLEAGQSCSDGSFSTEDAQALVVPVSASSSFKGVDVLLTSQWPKGVDKYASATEGVDSSAVGSDVISQVCITLKPRYHFCAVEGTFYERQPYRNHKILQQGAQHVTRFIAMAKVGNPQKKKFLYAFNVTPMQEMAPADLVKQPEDVTECPFRPNPDLLASASKEKGAQFFYDQKTLDKADNKKRSQDRQGGLPKKKHPQATGPCWFCLGSPEVEKHLVISVGTQCYLAMAKGGLTSDHALILPIGHHQSVVSSPSTVCDEIDKYKSALRKCLKSQGKAVVFFERNYKTQHLQIQAVPIEEELAAELKETFMGCALLQKFELHEIAQFTDLKQIVPDGAPYFHVELPSGERLLFRIQKNFSLQFGREVMADQSLLNIAERVDWRNCKSSKGDEVAMTKHFRELFQKYDFNEAI